MVLGYCNWKKPILGFSKPKNNQIKVSLRCSKLLAYDGIHFGNIMREIAKEVGGATVGGHAIACGAYIPNEKNQNFLINLIKVTRKNSKLNITLNQN